MTAITLDPVDALVLRGNRLFGGAVHGVAQMPPRPSVISGAIASRALADKGAIERITSAPRQAEEILAEVLGRDFRLALLGLERSGEALFPLPEDLVALEQEEVEGPLLHRVAPRALPATVMTSQDRLPLCPVLRAPSRRKPIAGLWIARSGLAAHLAGEKPRADQLADSAALWETEPRLGIALDADARTVEAGALYTTDVAMMKPGVRLLAVFEGDAVPVAGLVRLGGDGRGARLAPVPQELERDLRALGAPVAGWPGFRMILATPGLFADGWLPPGLDEGRRLKHEGLVAELVCASVPRREVVSGWDLAKHAPKPARSAVPAGSVYWFRVVSGDTRALASLREHGLWPLIADNDSHRAAQWREGWNRVWFGEWSP